MKSIFYTAFYLAVFSFIFQEGIPCYGLNSKGMDEPATAHSPLTRVRGNGPSSEIIPVNKQAITREKRTVRTLEKTVKVSKTPIKHAADCTFTIKGSKNIGSGFFISPDGYAITCKHVIENEPNQTAVLNSLEEYPIGVISTSSEYDLALILVTTIRKTPFLKLRDPFTLKPGEKVFAVGSSTGLRPTVTFGSFSGQRKRLSTKQRSIQFSAPVNPGNSGGPLIDKEGRVIGAISWKLLSNKGVPVTGFGFAVPSDYIIKEYRRYIE